MNDFAAFQSTSDAKLWLPECRQPMPAGRVCRMCSTRLSIWNRQNHCARHVPVALLAEREREYQAVCRRKIEARRKRG